MPSAHECARKVRHNDQQGRIPALDKILFLKIYVLMYVFLKIYKVKNVFVFNFFLCHFFVDFRALALF